MTGEPRQSLDLVAQSFRRCQKSAVLERPAIKSHGVTRQLRATPLHAINAHSGSVCALNLVTTRLLLAVAFVALLCRGSSAATRPKLVGAAAAYHRAEQLRARLEARPNSPVADYLAIARAFVLVYHRDPGYRNAPAALAAAAGIYAMAGRRYANDQYSSKAVETCKVLIAQYPHTRLSRDALLEIAEIYLRDIENPRAARDAYQEFVQRYPASTHAAMARREIARIDRSVAGPGPNPAGNPVTQANGAMPHAAQPGRVQEVEDVRDWVGRNYTRVLIRMGGEVQFHAIQLQNPPRLVFDLENTHLNHDLARKSFPVQSGFLRRIRVAQFTPHVTRVVLDVPHLEDYSVFALPDPFRLVIDVSGNKPLRMATVPPPGKTSRSAEVQWLHDGGSPDAARLSTSGANPDRSVSAPQFDALEGETVPEAKSMAPLENAPSTAAIVGPSLPAIAGSAPTLTRALGLKIRRIVIDPGHGGHDTGTIGPDGVEEKNVVLGVALRLRRLIRRKLGCQVIMTRTTDEFIPLEERTAIANEYSADLFISIHANASRDPSARGIETYYLNFTTDPEALAVAARENATSQASVFQLQGLLRKIALSEKIDESRDFARIMDRQLVTHLDEDGDRQPNRGIKKAPFVVLIGANMPSILAEISFLTNPHDERLLARGRFQEDIAEALYAGIAQYASSLGTIRVAHVAQQAGPAARAHLHPAGPSF
jgi:N-acetylmuramoyl-L-alanine amidase